MCRRAALAGSRGSGRHGPYEPCCALLTARAVQGAGAPLLVTAPLSPRDEVSASVDHLWRRRWGVLACTGTVSVLLRCHHEAPAPRQRCLAAGHTGTVLWRLPREKGWCEWPPWPGMARRQPLVSRRCCTRVPVSGDVFLVHHAGPARHRVASSSKVGSGMPACQVGSRNSSRLPLGSKK
jgi:hypothetical protein